MEQIYRKQFPHGSHTIYGQYDNHGNITISSFHYGSDVEDFWGNDEYEYYLTISKNEVPKFVLGCLAAGFNSEQRFSLHELQNMCDGKGIKYSTTSWV